METKNIEPLSYQVNLTTTNRKTVNTVTTNTAEYIIYVPVTASLPDGVSLSFDILHIEKKHSENISDYYRDRINLSQITDDIMRKILTRAIYNTPYTINYDGSIQFYCVEEIKNLLLVEEEKQIYMLLLQYYRKI